MERRYMTNGRIEAVATAYERERTQWDNPPSSCDASYFRLRNFVRLDAPPCIIDAEIELLRHKVAIMQRTRLGAYVH